MQQTWTHAGIPARGGPEPGGATREFLTFRLGAEHYGIDILRVQEIRRYERPTRLANAPDYLMGVSNLRGMIVPIIDFRIRFRLERAVYDDFTVVIILNLRERVVGMVVDAVSDVCALGDAQIGPTPEFASATFDTRYITGLGKQDEGPMLILLDIERLLTATDLAVVDAAAA